MSFLKWLDGLSATVDKALKAKSVVDVLVNAGHSHQSVTKPIRDALDFVKGLENDAKTDREAAEAPPVDKRKE